MSISTQITVVATAEQIIITAPGALRGPQGIPGPMGDVTPGVTQLVADAQDAAASASASKDDAQQSAALAGELKTGAETAAASAEDSAAQSLEQSSVATEEADRSKVEADRSRTEADRSKASADSALQVSGIYADIPTGLAATTPGKVFGVPVANDISSVILYENRGGAAIDTGSRYPSSTLVSKLARTVPSTAPWGEAGAVVDEDGLASVVFKPDGTTAFAKLEAEKAEVISLVAKSLGTANAQMKDNLPAGYQFVAGDNDGLIALGVKDSGAVGMAAIEELQSINGVPIASYLGGGASGAAQAGRFDAEINHILLDGQSRALGTDSGPAITLSQRYDNLMFVGGSRPYDNSIDPAVIFGSFQPLVESNKATLGETPASGLSECIKERIALENGLDYTDHTYQILASAIGSGGSKISALGVGTVIFDRCKAAINYGYALAQASGKSYKVRGFTWSQGESDYGTPGTDPAVYGAALIAIRDQLDAYAKSVTGQTEDVLCFIDQEATTLTTAGNFPYIAIKQWELCDTHPQFIMSCPIYHITPGGGHHSNTQSKLLGAYHGLAIKRTVVDREKFKPVQPIDVYRQGSIVFARFNVPAPPLVFDTAHVALTANYGFSLVDNAGTAIGISSVTLTGPDTVKIIAAAPVPSGSKLRSGFVAQRNNLRDSQGDAILFNGGGLNEPLRNWCVFFEKTIS